MTIATTCPCGKKYQVKEELAGKRVKCPACGDAFEVPLPPVDPLEAPSSDPLGLGSGDPLGLGSGRRTEANLRERTRGAKQFSIDDVSLKTKRRSAESGRASLKNVNNGSYGTLRLGISLVFYGLLLLVAALVLSILSPVIALIIESPIPILALFIVPIIIVAARIIGLVGKVLCLAVPDETGGKQIVYVAVILDVCAALINLAGFVVIVPKFLDSISTLLGLTAFVLFLVFLRQLAVFLRDSVLAERAAGVLKIGVGIVVTCVIAILGALFFPPLGMIAIVTIILGLIGFVLYLMLLGGLKQRLARIG
jgi:hypothetical protein